MSDIVNAYQATSAATLEEQVMNPNFAKTEREWWAAETISTLRAEVDRLRAVLVDAGASLAAAISLLERGGKKAAASDKMFAVMLDDYRKSLDRARAALGEEKKG